MRETTDKFQDFERQPVPLSLRKPWWTLALVYIAIAVNLAAILLGGQLADNLSFAESMAATVIGSILVATIAALCAYVGAKTRLSTAMVSRYTFGEVGSRIVSILLATTLFGWFGVQAGFFGASALVVVQNVLGVEVPTWLLSLIGGVLMTTTAVLGYRAIEKLSLIAVPLMIGLLIGSLYSVSKAQSIGALIADSSNGAMTIGLGMSLVAGAFMVGAVISPDISRWAKTTKDAVLSAFFGFFVGNVIMIAIAVILAKAVGTGDLIEIFLTLGLGTSALLILIFAQWTTNDNNLYSAALGFSVVIRNIPKWHLTIGAGIIGTTLAVVGIYDWFIPFLSLLTVLIAPLGGIYTAEYFLLNKHRFQFSFIQEKKIPVMMWRSMAAWAAASGIAFATTPVAGGGFGWLTLTTLPALDGFLSALVLQYLLGKIGNASEKQSDMSAAS
ncbi:cytosine permease [Desmospora profundinema]|uniref:Cytosine permease n=1 Tax=Desmospora profundinema TaxID=1571184 RepID=A0ABU1IQ87_9BACL|nr:cytosine permease [Desmospora profundinema]MDR6226702.1 cytosine permease [Desmospora profundinema]